MVYIIIPIFGLILMHCSFIQSQCIPFDECPAAVEYVTSGLKDPKIVKLLREADCGFQVIYGLKVPHIRCDKVSSFSDDCISIFDCPEAVKLIETRRGDPEVTKILSSAACGDSARKHYVRCTEIAEAVSRLPDNKFALLPSADECGIQQTDPRINGGDKAGLDEFPWLGLIKYRNSFGKITFGCHGTLISSKYVVTAAHCIDLYPSQRETIGEIYLIIFGEYDIRNKTDCDYDKFGQQLDCADPIQKLQPEKVIAHPGFDYPEGKHDIGLIRLRGSVTFSDFVKPICLPFQPLGLKKDDLLFITGWGKTEHGVYSEIKLKATIFFIPHNICRDIIRKYSLTRGQICAGSNNGSNVCNGDSGGPLMANRKRVDGVQTFLAGVVSFNSRCSASASIYTNVAEYTDWLLTNIKQ